IWSFASYMRPLIKIYGAHLKGTYLGKKLLDVRMDANNQIIPLAMGISQGGTVETWSWFMTNLKECIGEYWETYKAYLVPNFEKSISYIREVRLEAYIILEDARFEKWSRACGPTNRYNYMTSNCAESINALTKIIRKVPIMMLMDYYRCLIQRRHFERRYNDEDEPLADELSRWVAAKVNQRMLKNVTWTVHNIERCVGMTNNRRVLLEDKKRHVSAAASETEADKERA
nr:hypothetical protein [Tanacetum cinerariifolium]